MAYVAARGGEEAIQQAEQLFHTLKGPLTREMVDAIEQNMPYLVDRVMGESSLYAPRLAALALAQTGGDLYEAVLLLRAYRSTQPRLAYATPVTADDMLIVRRISAAFKEIPGGQVLGPTLDYSHRLLRTDVLDAASQGATGNTDSQFRPEKAEFQPADEPAPRTYPPVADWQREQGLRANQSTAKPGAGGQVNMGDVPDLTRGPLLFPAPRAHRLQALARADTGGVLSLGYANMRGYGGVHPTVNEVRLAYTDVQMQHPVTGVTFTIGRVRTSQAEIVSTFSGQPSAQSAPSESAPSNQESECQEENATSPAPPSGATTNGATPADSPANGAPQQLELGFAATLGWNEVKVIAAAMLDLAMDKPNPHPAHEEEFVLYHTEPVEASGFCIHYKLPHYVTFNSTLDNVREVMIASGWYKEPDDGSRENGGPGAHKIESRAKNEGMSR